MSIYVGNLTLSSSRFMYVARLANIRGLSADSGLVEEEKSTSRADTGVCWLFPEIDQVCAVPITPEVPTTPIRPPDGGGGVMGPPPWGEDGFDIGTIEDIMRRNREKETNECVARDCQLIPEDEFGGCYIRCMTTGSGKSDTADTGSTTTITPGQDDTGF